MIFAILCGDTMPDNESFLKWCVNQSRGIRLTKPSENLVKAYLGKSSIAMRSMDVNAEAGIDEWEVTTSYYARYFAVYALLAKIGVKCEIHDCTIALFDYLFHDRVSQDTVQELRQAKQDRVNSQYYTQQARTNIGDLVKRTKSFVLEIEGIIDKMKVSLWSGSLRR